MNDRPHRCRACGHRWLTIGGRKPDRCCPFCGGTNVRGYLRNRAGSRYNAGDNLKRPRTAQTAGGMAQETTAPMHPERTAHGPKGEL